MINDEEILATISHLMRFARKKIKSAKDSLLATAWNENFVAHKFLEKIKRYRNKIILGTMIGGAILGAEKISKSYQKKEFKTENTAKLSIADQNYLRAKELLPQTMVCLGNCEGFSDPVYWERSAHTQGYGSTKRFGVRVKKNDKPISETLSKEFLETVDPSKPYMENIKEGSMLKGLEMVEYHMENDVLPYVKSCDKVLLNDNQLVGVCIFIYNVGGKSFEKSQFCEAINEGKTGDDCSQFITLFRYQTITNKKKKKEKVIAGGLINRSYVTALIFNGDIKPELITDFGIKSIYSYPKEKLCANLDVQASQCLKLNLDKETIKDFVNFCVNDERFKKSTAQIMPKKFIKEIKQSDNYKNTRKQLLSVDRKGSRGR